MRLNADILSELCTYFNYPVSGTGYAVFAIRGSLPEATLKGDFSDAARWQHEHTMQRTILNYTTARCTIGLWNINSRKIALFSGSTLPSLHYLYHNPSALDTYNILAPGAYKLRKGIHPRSSNYQKHEALLMDGYGMAAIPQIIRGKKSFRFSKQHITYKVLLPGDNLHAARTEPSPGNDLSAICQEILKLKYSSSGCITITGQPIEYLNYSWSDYTWNSWETFRKYIQEYITTPSTDFLLFSYGDLKSIRQKHIPAPLRYGSECSQVVQLQQFLNKVNEYSSGAPYYNGSADGLFTNDTAAATLRFCSDFTGGIARPEIYLDKLKYKTQHFITI